MNNDEHMIYNDEHMMNNDEAIMHSDKHIMNNKILIRFDQGYFPGTVLIALQKTICC